MVCLQTAFTQMVFLGMDGTVARVGTCSCTCWLYGSTAKLVVLWRLKQVEVQQLSLEVGTGAGTGTGTVTGIGVNLVAGGSSLVQGNLGAAEDANLPIGFSWGESRGGRRWRG